MEVTWETDEISAHCHQILKLYIEALAALSYVQHPDGLSTTTPPQGYVLGAASGMGRAEEPTFQRQGREGGACLCRGPAHKSTGHLIFLMTSPRMYTYTHIFAHVCVLSMHISMS